MFKPQSQDISREIKGAERDKPKFQAIEAKGKSIQSILSAKSQARSRLDSSVNVNKRTIMNHIIANLMRDLSDNLP